jgi:crotonobetainyl-CoA:carnitine CoA-transferase CaiB-like acyl-CoA transferase
VVAESSVPTGSGGVFEGVRVLELAQWVFVPATGAVMADQGADVIKIENPATGDPYRGLMTQGVGALYGGVNLNVEQNNRGKRSVALDIRTAQGRELMYRLVERADVFLTNFRPEALGRLGYGVDDMRAHNPKVIYARGHGFGVRGPEANTPSYDSTAYWARGGFAHTLTPFDYDGEVGSRGAIGDKPSAMNLAYGIAAALFKRERTGIPTVVDVSLLGSAVWTLSSDILSTTIAPTPPDPAVKPNRPFAGYRTKDGRLITVQFLNEAHWPGFCRAIGREDLTKDPRFAARDDRIKNSAAYEAQVQATFAALPYDEWCTILRDSDAPWAPVQSAHEVAQDPQVAANNYLLRLETEDGTPYQLAGVPVEFDETPAAPGRAPDVGQHTEEVLLELGLTWDEIIELKLAEVLA